MPKKFPPVGRCIYCGTSSGCLSDEHIIAYGLNGTAELPQASCADCAETTSRIEQDFLRGPAWPMRAAFGFQTRRPKDVPKDFPVYVTNDGIQRKVMLPVAQYPLILSLPLFRLRPGYLEDRVVSGIEVTGVVSISLAPGIKPSDVLETTRKSLGVDTLELPSFDAFSFGRMVLKSAYALTVAEHGLSRIEEPLAAPAILGQKNDLGTLLGSTPDVSAPENAQHITRVTIQSRKGDSIAVVMMKLLGTLPAPIYVAVTARMKP